jgi:hypothetical protein
VVLLLLVWLVFGSTGVWTWDLVLARQRLCHLNLTPSPFCFGFCFEIGANLIPGLAWPRSSYLYFLCSWDDRCSPLWPAFIVWDGGSVIFFAWAVWNCDSPNFHLPHWLNYRCELLYLTCFFFL